jgi:hypothetical protein
MSINVAADEESPSPSPSPSSSQFEEFRWTDESTDDRLIEARHLNRLIGQTIDVADGVRALLEIAEFDDWLLMDDHTPLIDRCRQDSLRRLSVTALRLLSEEAARVGEWVRLGSDC